MDGPANERALRILFVVWESFPGSDLFLWLLLTATALLMSGFSSFIYQLTRKSGVF